MRGWNNAINEAIKSKKDTVEVEWCWISAIGKDHQQQKHWHPQQQSSRDAAAAAAERAAAAAKDRVEHYTIHIAACMQVNQTSCMPHPIRLVQIEKGPATMEKGARGPGSCTEFVLDWTEMFIMCPAKYMWRAQTLQCHEGTFGFLQGKMEEWLQAFVTLLQPAVGGSSCTLTLENSYLAEDKQQVGRQRQTRTMPMPSMHSVWRP